MMKISHLFVFLFFSVIVLSSCDYSKGFKTEPVIGLAYKYNGFRVNAVNLFDTDRYNPMKNKKIEKGKTLFISIENLTGFTILDNKIYPVCEVTVIDEEENIILYNENIYDQPTGYDTDTDLFSVTIRIGESFTAGNMYKTKALLYDKHSPEKVIEITVKSEVVD